MSNQSERQVFVFSHIPKTAGTTVKDMLRRNFGDHMISMPHDFLEGMVPSDRIDHWLRVQPQLRCLSGHRFSLGLPWDSPEFDFRVISFIRDPVDRLRSEYKYIRKEGIADASGLAKSSASFQAFAKSICDDDDSQMRGRSQYWHLTQGTDFGPERIAELVDAGKLILYPTHRLDAAGVLLEKRFPDSFRDASTRTLNTNRGKHDSPVELDDGVLGRLNERLAHDHWLVELADRCMNEHIAEVGQAAFDDHLAKLKRAKQIRRWIKSPALTFATRLERLMARW